MIDDDPFDIASLIPTDEQVGEFQARQSERLAVVPERIRKRKQQFVKVPGTWVEKLADAKHIATYRVALHLLYEHWRSRGQAVALPNGMLAKGGVARGTKWRALRELEQLGLVQVERRPRKSPLVTLLNPAG
jgi:hypothetical protein